MSANLTKLIIIQQTTTFFFHLCAEAYNSLNHIEQIPSGLMLSNFPSPLTVFFPQVLLKWARFSQNMFTTLVSAMSVEKKDNDSCALQQLVYFVNIAFVVYEQVIPSVDGDQTIFVERRHFCKYNIIDVQVCDYI